MFQLCALVVVLADAGPLEWERAASQAGVEVFTRFEGRSRYKAFRAVTRIDAPRADVIAVVEDVERYVEWFGFTKTARVLEENDEARLIQLETEFPWPFANEDMIYRLSQRATEDGVVLTFEGLPNARARVDGVQRMRSASGRLELRSVAGATEVVFTMHSELGGNVPHWLANQNVHELPMRTLSNLKRRLERR